jgi:VanZ family protein
LTKPAVLSFFNHPPLTRLRHYAARRPFWYYTTPLLAWTGMIAWATLAPAEDLPELRLPYSDKLEHGAVYAILGLLFCRAWIRRDPPRRRVLLAVWLIASLWGFYLEFLQLLTGYRTFDLWDEATNALAVALGIGLFALTRRWWIEPVMASAVSISSPGEESA